MTVCQFYLRGQCKFGDHCRNEHPPRQTDFETNSWNSSSSNAPKSELPYNAANIANDLNPKGERPLWPLSSYAPFKNETTLIEGLDESPEELRVKAVTTLAAGNVNEYIQYESNQIANAERVYSSARNNSSQAFEQARNQSKLLKNAASLTSTFPSTSSAFNNVSSSSIPSAPVFGSTSTPSTFGNSSATGAFGAPAANSAFGKSTFGQPNTTLFGQPSSSFGQTGFGQPPALGGQPASTGQSFSAFGQPSTSTTTAFGQSTPTGITQGGDTGLSIIKPASSAFGAFAGTGASPFGAGSTPNTNAAGNAGGGGFSSFAGQSRPLGLMDGTDAFAATAQTTGTTTSAFGSSVFGQPRQQQAGSVFSSLANNGNADNTGSVFGAFGSPAAATSQPASLFGGGNGQTTQVPGLSTTFGGGGSNMANSGSSQQQPVSVFGQLAGTTTTAFSASLSSTGLVPSISMASSNSGGSTLPAASPMSTFPPPTPLASNNQLPSSSSSKGKGKTNAIDFASLIAGTTYQPGSTPYNLQLPQNYSASLPARVMEAFKKEKFSWWWKDDGAAAVPEWVPPLDIR